MYSEAVKYNAWIRWSLLLWRKSQGEKGDPVTIRAARDTRFANKNLEVIAYFIYGQFKRMIRTLPLCIPFLETTII